MSLASVKKRKNKGNSSPPASEPSYLPNVIKKVRAHFKEEKLTEDDIKTKAKQFTDPEELYMYFSHLADRLFEEKFDEVREEADFTNNGETFNSGSERDMAKQRATDRLHKSSLKITLKLHKLEQNYVPPIFASNFARMMGFKYGPLHAALLVGDVVLEWDSSSLVIPHYDNEDPIKQFDVTGSISRERETELQSAADSLDFNQQIILMFDASVCNRKMIDELIKVIMAYNRLYEYDFISRNCQTFVTEAMKAMGAKNPQPIAGRLDKYLSKLKKEKKNVPDMFQTHNDLDEYVNNSKSDGKFSQFTQYDKEFLLVFYFKFHLQTMEEHKGDRCRVPTCMMHEVESSIESPFILEHSM